MISDGDSNISAGFENTQGYKDAIQDAWKEGATQYLQEGVKSDQVYEMLKDQIDLKKKDADLCCQSGTFAGGVPGDPQIPGLYEAVS